MTTKRVLLIIGLILLVLAAFGVDLPIVIAGWLGLAFWCASELV